MPQNENGQALSIALWYFQVQTTHVHSLVISASSVMLLGLLEFVSTVYGFIPVYYEWYCGVLAWGMV